jgi:hypothetical protein
VRPDLFQARKCIHVKLKKEVHSAFRTKLFDSGLSMQEVIDEFARLFACGDKRAEAIVNDYVKRKLDEELQKLMKEKEKCISELDQDTLYDMIGSGPQSSR